MSSGSNIITRLPFNGVFTDKKHNEWTTVGDMTYDEGKFKRSLKLLANNYAYCDGSSLLDVNADDWTISFWLKPYGGLAENHGVMSLFATEKGQEISSRSGISFENGWWIPNTNASWLQRAWCNPLAWGSASEWCHVALSHRTKDSMTYAFVNGVLKGSASLPNIRALYSDIAVGVSEYGLSTQVNIEDFFISKECLWTEDFTPPNSTFLANNILYLDANNAVWGCKA